MKIFMTIITAFLGAIFAGLVVGLLSGLVVRFLWNFLDDTLFHIHNITFLQAWALMWLLAFLATPFKTTVSSGK